MSNRLLNVLFILFFTTVMAQNISVDSLNKLATSLTCRDIKKSDSLAKLVLKKINQEDELYQSGKAYKSLGKNLLCQTKLDKAIELLLKSNSFFKKINNENEYAKVLNNLAVAYRTKGDFDKAISLCREQIEIANRIKNDTIKASAYAIISGVYSNKELVDSTAIYAEKGLEIAKKSNIQSLVWKLTMILGAASQSNKDFDKAIAYYEDILPLLEELNNFSYLGMLYNNLAGCYMGLKQFDKAIKVYNDNLTLSTQANNKRYIVVSNSGLAHVYSDIDNYSVSNGYYFKTLEGAEELNLADVKVDALSNLTNNFYKQGQFQKAIEYGNKALTYAKEKSFLVKEIETYNYMFQIHKAIGDSKKALEYLELYSKKDKERLDQEKTNKILELQTKFEVDKNELLAENALKAKTIAEEKSRQNKNYFIGATCIGILILFSSLMFYGRNNAKKKAELISLELKETQKRLALEKQYRHSELKALKAQMDPHFIFNALNSIQEYIILNQKNLASDYLGKFADLMRKYLNHSDKRAITLSEEVDCLQMYLELEAIRFEEKLEYSITVDNTLNTEEAVIPTMLIQPYVENALKHGLLHKKNNKKLLISLSKFPEKQVLICIIEDNGVGRKKAEEFNSKRSILHRSFATKATESRLKLLNYGREKQIGIVYEDLINNTGIGVGTKVIISIPFSIA